MDDLLKITNEMVKTINNTSNFTNIQNTTIWKSPTQVQQEKVDEFYQQFLESQTWGNNLTQETTRDITDKKPTKPTTKPTTTTSKPPTKPGNMPTKPKDVIIKNYEKNEYNVRGSKVVEKLKKTWEILDITLNKVEQILNIIQSLDSMFKLGILMIVNQLLIKLLMN